MMREENERVITCQDCLQPLILIQRLGSMEVLQCFSCKDDFGSGRIFMQHGAPVTPPQETIVYI